MEIYRAFVFIDEWSDIKEERYFKSRENAISWLKDKYIDDVKSCFWEETRECVKNILENYPSNPEKYKNFIEKYLRECDMYIITEYSECIDNSFCTRLKTIKIYD